jgi:acyl-CoA dehydrogenase
MMVCGKLKRRKRNIERRMARPIKLSSATGIEPVVAAGSRDAMYPLTFSTRRSSDATDIYLNDPSLRKLVEFFENKGLEALKEEDQRQQWYEDWISYQASHGIYASILSPKQYSSLGNELDLLRLTRFLEVFAYFSPAHGYSLQVTFLGLFAILMGSNAALKQEAVTALEKGALFAFGISERNHGSDLLASEFTVASIGPGKFVANGGKYYIGNANSASIISILGQKIENRQSNRVKRASPVLIALRPEQSGSFGHVRKIPTLGIRAAFVGEFQVKDHQLPQRDFIAEGRAAWDAVLGTVALGRFFLGFGSIGICERACEEAVTHLVSRVLYGKPVIDMPHIGSAVAQAYARLTAMKLYAYRAHDYFHIATANDRRYLLFSAVQKAKVSTEGVKVISLLSECIGARGFEAETYFEMALRDVQLIPRLEGSTHINLSLTAQFIPRYFTQPDDGQTRPASLAAGQIHPGEVPYLMEARGGHINSIAFRSYLDAYQPLRSVPNVRLFIRQARLFGRFVRGPSFHVHAADLETALALGQCLATIAYGQLIAENSALFDMPPQLVSTIFHLLVSDLSASALALASSSRLSEASRALMEHMVAVPRTSDADWDFVLQRAMPPNRDGVAAPP